MYKKTKMAYTAIFRLYLVAEKYKKERTMSKKQYEILNISVVEFQGTDVLGDSFSILEKEDIYAGI